MSEISIYETTSGSIEVRLERDTVWLSQEQMGTLFGRERSVITKHVRNVFTEGELEEESNVQNMHIAGSDKPVRFYNLDVIISVSYRVKSPQGTRFRQWATRILREHLTQGYTLNRQRFETNARELEAALQLVRKAVRSPELQADMGRGLVDIVTRYTQTFVLLQRYDEGLLTEPTTTPGGTIFTLPEARAALARLKADLMARGEASTLFAQEREEAFASLLCRESRSERVRGAGVPERGVQSRPPAVLHYQKSPFCRRQQAERRVSVRGFSESQRSASWLDQATGDQRHRAGGIGALGGRIKPIPQRHGDPPDHEHAGSGNLT